MTVGYCPRLVVKDGRFHFVLDELRLIGSGDSVEAAYADLALRRKAVEEQFSAAGLSSELPPPRPVDPSRWAALQGFAAKAGIVVAAAGLVLFMGSVALNAYSARVTRFAREFTTSVAAPALVDSVQKELQRNVDKLGPERQQVMAENARILVDRLKPVVRELRPLFVEDLPAKSCPR